MCKNSLQLISQCFLTNARKLEPCQMLIYLCFSLPTSVGK
uniref:Uncharacterized protein n=1 Tax=Anguilla anguilla TaxID=7936 RepID=A0A0E9Q199_ANGAN